MFIGRVTGTVVCTQKDASMRGQTLFVVEPLRVSGETGGELKSTGRSFVVVDTVGAGEGETVLCVQGSSARYTEETKTLPIDAAIVGIVDSVTVGGTSAYAPDSPPQPESRP